MPPLDEVTIRPFPLGVEQEDGEGRGRVALARGEGGEFGREVECLYAGEGGQVVGLVTLGDGTSKQEEKSSNVDPMIFRPSLSRGKVAKGLTEEPSL